MVKSLSNKRFIIFFIFICFYALLSHLYFVFRYSGQWVETDSVFIAKAIKSVFLEGTLTPSENVYSNGFGYQVIASFIVNITNISIQQYAQYYHPIITASSVFIIYSLFNEFTKDRNIALLSTFLLLLQPDLLFTSSRNTHEGFTYFLIMMAMLALAKSFSKTNFSVFVPMILIFYLSIFALTSMNSFFAFSFVFAITFAFVAGCLFSNKFSQRVSFKRLSYSSSISIIIIFLTIFYIYPPSNTLLTTMDYFYNQANTLLLTVEAQSTPQYDYIYEMWVSPYVWFFLTLFNWIIAPMSFIMWLMLAHDFFKQKNQGQFNNSLSLLLMFYAVFSIQLVISIIADRFVGIGSNIELRIFPVLIISAVPLAGMLIFRIVGTNRSFFRKLFIVMFIILIMIFSINSLLKGTNDPLVSYRWMFYSMEEEYSIRWGDTHGKNIERAEVDERLGILKQLLIDVDPYGKGKASSIYYSQEKYILLSNIAEKRALLLGRPLPQISDNRTIYNSGSVKIYKN